jgi:ferredoxin
MGLIPKIVSTPIKWASKKVLHHTLLRFPGGDAHQPMVCVYCPEMCRFSCPTAVVSANDAVTPCNKMGLLYKETQWPGRAAQGQPLWPLYDCTGCGRCTEYCVYEMPVMETLFKARQKYKWPTAEKAASQLTDEEDSVGDLAEELGDSENAQRRLRKYLNRALNPGESHQTDEPKSLYFLNKNGISATLSWEKALLGNVSPRGRERLADKRWLLHESVWYNRHLGRSAEIQKWAEKAADQNINIYRPFAHGRDCIDCGGEGAYLNLFSTQANQMAAEIWERDHHQADGVLCMSLRCAKHFRRVLGSEIPVIALSELYG